MVKALYALALFLGLSMLAHSRSIPIPTLNQIPSVTAMDTPNLFNVKTFGAVGDGSADDTASVQKAAAALLSAPFGGSLYFPTGRYRITQTINLELSGSTPPLQIVGDGWSSIAQWSFDGHLFAFTGAVASKVSIMHLQVLSIYKQTPTSAAFAFTVCTTIIFRVFATLLSFFRVAASHFSAQEGVTDSVFFHLTVTDDNNGNNIGSAFDLGPLVDTVSILECHIWKVTGTGVKIGRGSEVRIEGGRIIGLGVRTDASIGVHVTGNNGGVHIIGTDVIGLGEGVRLDNSSGQTSNREIFLSQATLDSNGRGLSVLDNSYVSFAGCWAASSAIDNIWVAPGLDHPIIMIVGGTIFNGGTYGCPNPDTECNGITVNSGTFQITGTVIRNNQGRGVWVDNDAVKDYTITGCRIFENGRGLDLQGSEYIVANNVFTGNSQPNIFTHPGGSVISNNLGA